MRIESGYCVTPRYRLKYYIAGEGPPLAIIHGLNDIPQSFAGIIDHLKPHYTCITYHLPEGGRDGVDLHKYQHRHFVEDLIILLDSLQLTEVNLLGSSFGTTIALRTAALHPKSIDKLILQGGFACRPFNNAERFLAALGRSWPWRMGQLPIRHRVMRHLEGPVFPDRTTLEQMIRNGGESTIRAVTHRARILQRLDLRPLLPMIHMPMLMIGGDRDAIVPRRCEAEVEAGVPQAQRIEFSVCGHYPQYTHAGAMAAAIRQFLNSDDSRQDAKTH